jgi:hypothetical protein
VAKYGGGVSAAFAIPSIRAGDDGPAREMAMSVPTIEVDIAKLGYDAKVADKPLFVRIKKTLPWGVTREVEGRIGADGKIDKPMDYTEQMFVKLVVEWNLTPKACGYENGDLAYLKLGDLAADKVMPLPAHDPKIVAAVPTDVVTACINAYGDANTVAEKVEDFSKTS